MRKFAVLIVLVAVAAGSLAQGPTKVPCVAKCGCGMVYDPVCGTDGETYTNEGCLKCAATCRPGLKVFQKGECKAPETEPAKCVTTCGCASYYDPVCGNDGKTYSNQGCLDCQKECNPSIKMISKGECSNPAPSPQPIPEITTASKCVSTCACASFYDPVCGNDGQTYSNEGCLSCQLECNPMIKMIYKGECGSPAPEVPGPSIITIIETTPATRAQDGVCDVPCVCTRVYSPVCGNDGKTYTNQQCMTCAAKCNPSLKMVKEGECADPAEDDSTTIKLPSGGLAEGAQGTCATGCICAQQWDPVCGSDNKTYTNKDCLQCEAGCKFGLQAAYEGECTQSPPGPPVTPAADPEACKSACICAQFWDPVCGSDGRTYTNEGCLSCAANCTPEGLKIQHKGECSAKSS